MARWWWNGFMILVWFWACKGVEKLAHLWIGPTSGLFLDNSLLCTNPLRPAHALCSLSRQVSLEYRPVGFLPLFCSPCHIVLSFSFPSSLPLFGITRSLTGLSLALGVLLRWPSMPTVSIRLNVVAAALDWQLPTLSSSFPLFFCLFFFSFNLFEKHAPP